MKVKGKSGIVHEIYYYNKEKRSVIEVYKDGIKEVDMLGLLTKLLDLGIDRKRNNNSYIVRVIAPYIAEPKAADYIRKSGYVFIESKTPETTAEEIKTLIG